MYKGELADTHKHKPVRGGTAVEEHDCRGALSTEEISASLPGEETVQASTDFFKVFGDSTRLRILFALEGRELCVHTLADLLGVTQSAISHQLKILRDADLVVCRRAGKHIFYRLSDEHIGKILDTAIEHISE